MSDRTFKLEHPPMAGVDIQRFQREMPRLFARMGIDYPVDNDGFWGEASRDAAHALCKASGLLHEREMSGGVTPEVRTKLRNRPDDYTAAERGRFVSRELVDYRRKLRARARRDGKLPDTFPGSPIPGTRRLTLDHPTAGLAGFPARDYFAPAGSPCVAPVDGKVSRLSGHDPAGGPVDGLHGPFGWSLYVAGDDGHTYFLTHLGRRDISVGERVRQGEQIGTVGDYARWGGSDHIHQGVHA